VRVLRMVSPAAVPTLPLLVVVRVAVVSSAADSAVVMSISTFLFILWGEGVGGWVAEGGCVRKGKEKKAEERTMQLRTCVEAHWTRRSNDQREKETVVVLAVCMRRGLGLFAFELACALSVEEEKEGAEARSVSRLRSSQQAHPGTATAWS